MTAGLQNATNPTMKLFHDVVTFVHTVTPRNYNNLQGVEGFWHCLVPTWHEILHQRNGLEGFVHRETRFRNLNQALNPDDMKNIP